ncbi:MAG: hypothetical protein ACREFP_18420 [Acetobacteraceae bacterium]
MSEVGSHLPMQPGHSAQAAITGPAGLPSTKTRPAAAAELPMGVHPFVVVVALAGWGFVVVALFLLFLFMGSSAAQILVLVAVASLMMLGLIVGCGITSRNVATRGGVQVRQAASFREFLAAEVQVGDDLMRGSEIFGLALVMGLTLVIIGVGMVVAIAVA